VFGAQRGFGRIGEVRLLMGKGRQAARHAILKGKGYAILDGTMRLLVWAELTTRWCDPVGKRLHAMFEMTLGERVDL
jgi:hypothetical protein